MSINTRQQAISDFFTSEELTSKIDQVVSVINQAKNNNRSVLKTGKAIATVLEMDLYLSQEEINAWRTAIQERVNGIQSNIEIYGSNQDMVNLFEQTQQKLETIISYISETITELLATITQRNEDAKLSPDEILQRILKNPAYIAPIQTGKYTALFNHPFKPNQNTGKEDGEGISTNELDVWRMEEIPPGGLSITGTNDGLNSAPAQENTEPLPENAEPLPENAEPLVTFFCEVVVTNKKGEHYKICQKLPDGRYLLGLFDLDSGEQITNRKGTTKLIPKDLKATFNENSANKKIVGIINAAFNDFFNTTDYNYKDQERDIVLATLLYPLLKSILGKDFTSISSWFNKYENVYQIKIRGYSERPISAYQVTGTDFQELIGKVNEKLGSDIFVFSAEAPQISYSVESLQKPINHAEHGEVHPYRAQARLFLEKISQSDQLKSIFSFENNTLTATKIGDILRGKNLDYAAKLLLRDFFTESFGIQKLRGRALNKRIQNIFKIKSQVDFVNFASRGFNGNLLNNLLPQLCQWAGVKYAISIKKEEKTTKLLDLENLNQYYPPEIPNLNTAIVHFNDLFAQYPNTDEETTAAIINHGFTTNSRYKLIGLTEQQMKTFGFNPDNLSGSYLKILAQDATNKARTLLWLQTNKDKLEDLFLEVGAIISDDDGLDQVSDYSIFQALEEAIKSHSDTAMLEEEKTIITNLETQKTDPLLQLVYNKYAGGVKPDKEVSTYRSIFKDDITNTNWINKMHNKLLHNKSELVTIKIGNKTYKLKTTTHQRYSHRFVIGYDPNNNRLYYLGRYELGNKSTLKGQIESNTFIDYPKSEE